MFDVFADAYAAEIDGFAQSVQLQANDSGIEGCADRSEPGSIGQKFIYEQAIVGGRLKTGAANSGAEIKVVRAACTQTQYVGRR